MYEMTDNQFLTVPLNGEDDHAIISKLIRLSVESKRKVYPALWGESTLERPAVNLKVLYQGVIVGGEISFYINEQFVTFKYDRQHSVNIHRFKTNAGDGRYYITGVWIGNSPKTNLRMWVPEWRWSRNREMTNLLALWTKLDMDAELNG